MFYNLLLKFRDIVCPILQYEVFANSTNMLIKEEFSASFNATSLSSYDYMEIYLKIFIECIKKMNTKNRNLILSYFMDESPKTYNQDFINPILTNYINNLSKKEINLLSKTGYFSPYYKCKTEIVTNNYLNALCLGYIKIFLIDNEIKVKIIWNKFSTVSSVMPLCIITSSYTYFSQKTDLLNNFSQTLRNIFNV